MKEIKMINKKLLPSTAALELTYRCNHKCIFCSCPWEANNDYKESELSLEEWYRVIDTLIKYGVNGFTLTGGEPLMRDDVYSIMDYILFKGANLNIISNGRKITDEFLDFLAERKISICISVPGIETFSQHTARRT